MKFTNIFKDQFYQALRTPAGNNPVRDRSDSFLKVFELLEEKNKDFYTIVETGCMRADHGQLAMGDDGASTYLLDKFVNHYDGQVFSVDISENNCNHARSFVSEKTTVVCEDSVRFLWNLDLDKPIDFLYLDSYDIDRNNPHPSQLHHVKELCAIISRLGSGTIVVIDDHDAFFTGGQVGKGTYVKDFMDNIGATLLFEDYQIGWIL